MARCSRGSKRDVEQLGRRFGVLKSFGQHSEGEGLHSSNGFVVSGTVAHGTRQFSNFGEPAAIILAFEFDGKADAHGRTVARVQRHG